MPSVALRLRADGDGDGYADIWRTSSTAFASIANYLRDAGWKPNVPWGIPVRTPPNLNRAAIASTADGPTMPAGLSRATAAGCTMREWRALGVVPLGRTLPDNEMASADRARRLQRDGLSADHQLSRDPRLQLLEFLRDIGRGSGGRDCAAIDRGSSPTSIGEFGHLHVVAHVLLATAARCSFASAAPAAAPQFDTPAKVAYLIDLSSGAVLYDKNADVRMPPASMAKMMTTEVAFELIDKGQLPLNKMCTVRPETWQKWHGPAAGSTMFLSPNEQVSVENLLQGHRHPVGQ